uniref:Domain of unknown function DB domain-containing protein n=1 Tax=Panagrellus redivivus TaxID=6233 RepID=A0A7E4VTM8_PANRE
MDHKLLLFVIAFAIVAASASTCYDACSAYGKYDVYDVYEVNITAYDHILYGDAYRSANLPDDERKLLCHIKLNRLIFAYKAVENDVTKRDFGLFCQNVTEIMDCYQHSNFSNRHHPGTLLGVSEDFYICGTQIFAMAHRLCGLKYERVMQIKKCFNAASKSFIGGISEKHCRQGCCHQPPAVYPGPLLCAPEKDIYEAWIRPCCAPKVDKTLKGNACMKICMMDHFANYAKDMCDAEAVATFDYYACHMRFKYFNAESCFQKCPNCKLTGFV